VIGILDAQPDYNLYEGDAEESIEPFNPQICVELTGHQTVADNRCLDVGGAGIYITGKRAMAHHILENWDNSLPWPSTVGVLLGPGTDEDIIDGIENGGRSPRQ